MAFESLLPLLVPAVRLFIRLMNADKTDPADTVDDVAQLVIGVANKADQRSIARGLEEMGDQLLRDLDKQIGAEYRDLDEGDLSAAALAVADAIERFSGESLAQTVARHDADANRIVTKLRSTKAVKAWMGELGTSGASLADFVMRELIYRIIASAERVPQFSFAFLVELLERTGNLLELQQEARIALQLLPARTARAVGENVASREERARDQFTLEYRRALINENDRLEVYGLDLAMEVRRYQLTTAYIPLRVQSRAADDELLAPATRLHQIVPASGGLTLYGAAGAGKTTLMQWLAVNVARETLPRPLAKKLHDTIPCFLRLRNYVDQPLPQFDVLITASLRYAPLVPCPSDWLLKISESHRLLFLIDGLDEFPENRTTELADWCRALRLALNGRCLFVNTGRPTAKNMGDALEHTARASHEPADWVVAEIQPMDRDEIRKFVLHWHGAISSPQSEVSGDFEYGISAVRVADTLSSSRHYRQIASTPLLCAALCALFHVRRGALPATRADAYQTLASMLINRERQRLVLAARNGGSLAEPAWGQTTDEQLFYLFEEFAEFLLSNGLSEVDFDRADSCFARAWEGRMRSSQSESDLLRALVERSGIIREPAGGRVDFYHRSFLEYFAAGAMVRRDMVEALASNAKSPNWSGTVVLAAARANETQLTRLVDGLFQTVRDEPPIDQRPPAWRVSVCGGILDEVSLLTAELHERLSAEVRRALPARSAEEDRAISAAGESVGPDLVESLNAQGAAIDVGVLSAAVREIADFGGIKAIEQLANLTAQARLATINDILRIWAWFELDDYCARVLEGLDPTEPMEVLLTSSRGFPYLHRLSSKFRWKARLEYPEESIAADCSGAPIVEMDLQNLQFLSNTLSDNFSFLWQIQGLRSLRLTGAADFGPSDESVLTGLQHLELLNMTGQVDLTLVDLRTLVKFSLSGDVVAILPSEKCESLMSLELSNDAIVDGLDGQLNASHVILTRASASNLPCAIGDRTTSLAMVDVFDLDLTCLRRATNLESLELEDCSELDDPSPLLEVPSLRSVAFFGSTPAPDDELHNELGMTMEISLNDDVDPLDSSEDDEASAQEWNSYLHPFWDIDDWGGANYQIDLNAADFDGSEYELVERGEPTSEDLRMIEVELERVGRGDGGTRGRRGGGNNGS